MKFREAYVFFIIGAVIAVMAVVDRNRWLYLISGIMIGIGLIEWIITDIIEAWQRSQKKKNKRKQL
jgi:hypothetical protein